MLTATSQQMAQGSTHEKTWGDEYLITPSWTGGNHGDDARANQTGNLSRLERKDLRELMTAILSEFVCKQPFQFFTIVAFPSIHRANGLE